MRVTEAGVHVTEAGVHVTEAGVHVTAASARVTEVGVRQRNCVSERMLPSGSANQATLSPPGVVQTPSPSWSMPS